MDDIGIVEFKIGDWTARVLTNELVNGDACVRLEARAMDVLKMLYENRGCVVSKDVLIDSVWKLQVVSDHSITVVISNLRRALQDDPRCPQYIETIPKRGYRMIAPSTDVAPDDIKPAACGRSEAHASDLPATATARLGKPLAGAIAVVSIVLVILAYFLIPTAPPPPMPRLFVLDTVNATADAVFDPLAATLTELTLDTLSRAKGIRLVRWRREPDPPSVADTDEHDQMLVTKLITGERGPLMSMKLIAVETQSIIWSTTEAVSTRHFRRAEANALKSLSPVLGITVQFDQQPKFPAGIEEMFWRARYLWTLRQKAEAIEARQLLWDVLEQEPEFGRAHAALADLYTHKTGIFFQGTDDDSLARAQAHIASAESLSPGSLEVRLARAHYALFVDGDAPTAVATLSVAVQQAPYNTTVWVSYANALASVGRIDAAVDAIETAQTTDPMDAALRLDKVWILFLAERYDAALNAAAAASDLGISTALYQGMVWGAAGNHPQAIEAWMAFLGQRGNNMEQVQAINAAVIAHDYRLAYSLMGDRLRPNDLVLAALLYALAEDYAQTRSLIAGITGAQTNWLKLWLHRVPILKRAYAQIDGAAG